MTERDQLPGHRLGWCWFQGSKSSFHIFPLPSSSNLFKLQPDFHIVPGGVTLYTGFACIIPTSHITRERSSWLLGYLSIWRGYFLPLDHFDTTLQTPQPHCSWQEPREGSTFVPEWNPSKNVSSHDTSLLATSSWTRFLGPLLNHEIQGLSWTCIAPHTSGTCWTNSSPVSIRVLCTCKFSINCTVHTAAVRFSAWLHVVQISQMHLSTPPPPASRSLLTRTARGKCGSIGNLWSRVTSDNTSVSRETAPLNSSSQAPGSSSCWQSPSSDTAPARRPPPARLLLMQRLSSAWNQALRLPSTLEPAYQSIFSTKAGLFLQGNSLLELLRRQNWKLSSFASCPNWIRSARSSDSRWLANFALPTASSS